MEKQQSQPRMLKTAVIKEELVALTGNWRKALILNQFIYWSQHRGSQIDTQRFWEEERLRNELDLQSFEHGWIYKKASELIDELMLDITPVTIRQDIQALVEMGLLDQRPNPDDRLDRTLQYRPNIMNIQYALQCLGYSLDRYPLLLDENGSFIPRLENSKSDDRNKIIKVRDLRVKFPELSNLVCSISTETTAEITNKEYHAENDSLTQAVQPTTSVQPNSTHLSSQINRDEEIDSESIDNPSCTESVQPSQTESLTTHVQPNQTPLLTTHVKAAAPQKKPRRAAATNPPRLAVLAQDAPDELEQCDDMGELAQTTTDKKPRKSTVPSEQTQFKHALLAAFGEETKVVYLATPGTGFYNRCMKEIGDFIKEGITVVDAHNFARWFLKNNEYWRGKPVSILRMFDQYPTWLQRGKPTVGSPWIDPMQPKPQQPTSTPFDYAAAMYTKETQPIDTAMSGEITF